MKNILVFLIAYILFGCQPKSDPIGPKLGDEFELRFGQTVHIQDQNLSIEFASVTEDSRCPEGAICKWQGNAKVAIQVNEKDLILNTTLEPKEIEYSGYRIELISVSPYPKINEKIKQADYKIILVIKNK
jgi:hypothetical protein